MQNKEADSVNHPTHYTKGNIECIEAIKSAVVEKSGFESVCVANVIKYLWRYAGWYLDRLIKFLEEEKKNV